MGLDEDTENVRIKSTPPNMSPHRSQGLSTQPSGDSCYATDQEEEIEISLELGPQVTIKEHLEKDKDDESLRRWKEQLLGSVDAAGDVETLEADVKIVSLTIICPGRDDIVLQIPDNEAPKGVWFTLKEGTHYRLRFAIKVSNNIVSGLRYTNTVWKTGIKVDNSKEMLGTFSPQVEPYLHEMPEDTAPSGYFARGSYSAKTKFLDDDNKCHLEINYMFAIQKDWPK